MIAAWATLPARREAALQALGGRCERPERLDDLCLGGLAVAALALERAGLGGGAHRVYLATSLGCTETDLTFYRQVLDVGLARANPRIFAYTLPNIVLGEIAIAHKLTGDSRVLSAGRASGLQALGEAALALTHGEIEAALVLSLEAPGPATLALIAAMERQVTPSWEAIVLRADANGPEVRDIASGFDPTPESSTMLELGGGLARVLDALERDVTQPVRFEARCGLGFTASLTLLPGAGVRGWP